MTTEQAETRDATPAAEPLALKSNDGLGLLPEPAFHGVRRGGLLREDGWTADQMRAYAMQERAAEREMWRTLLGGPHLYRGDCPDSENFHARDPKCKACRKLGAWKA